MTGRGDPRGSAAGKWALRLGHWGLGQNLHRELRAESLASRPRGEEILGLGVGEKEGKGPKRSAGAPCFPDAPKDVRVQQTSPSSEIHSGHRVLLGCNFSSSRPRDVRFFWKKNGIFLKEGRELSFDSISPEDAGNYNCLVNNSVGQTTSEAKMLRVLCEWRVLETRGTAGDSDLGS